MTFPSNIQALLDARSKAYGASFEQLDVEGVLSWHSEATVFHDLAFDKYGMSRRDVADQVFSKAFPAAEYMRILEARTTGTPTHCTWETLLEVAYYADIADLGIRAGQKALLRIASVLDWRWEGPGEGWDGSLEDEVVRGWKIVRECDYTAVISQGSEGEKARIF